MSVRGRETPRPDPTALAQAQHAELVAQQQAVLAATQAAQALLETQGHHLCPEEKEKLQRNVTELKTHFESALAASETAVRRTRSLQEELQKWKRKDPIAVRKSMAKPGEAAGRRGGPGVPRAKKLRVGVVRTAGRRKADE